MVQKNFYSIIIIIKIINGVAQLFLMRKIEFNTSFFKKVGLNPNYMVIQGLVLSSVYFNTCCQNPSQLENVAHTDI